MLDIVFSKYSFVFYALMLGVEFLIKYLQASSANHKLILFKLADLGCVAGFLFLVSYSYFTTWWALIGLLAMNVLLFTIINTLLNFVNRANLVRQIKMS